MAIEPSPDVVAGKIFAFTGKLASMTREEATRHVVERGARVVEMPESDTDYLVVGREGWPLDAQGRLTRKLERAHALHEERAAPEILSEDRFLEVLGLQETAGNVQRAFTAAQLARILGIRRSRILSWVRNGLVAPVRTVHRLAYFDFRQVADAKRLCELVESGISETTVRRSLERLRKWFPDMAPTLSGVPLVRSGSGLLVRLEGGALAEPGGQLVFDFVEAAREAATPIVERTPRTVDEWFAIGLHCEDDGDLEGASEAYQQALLLGGPRAEICFNLANVLYLQERREQSVERFRQAIELEPKYVEAWNNLGNVLSELGDHEGGVAALRRAISIAPDYADAHYNLAETYFQMGNAADARRHWLAYLEEDPDSPWADRVRERLRQIPERVPNE